VAIIEKIDEIFGTKTRHKHNDERGTDVVIKTYKKTADQVSALETILRMLLREGIKSEQIVILSPIRYSNSAASLITECVVSELPVNNAVFYSTIHGFKGLESPVIILTDIDNLTDDARMNILYVGMTRAKSALYILAQEKTAKQLGK
jgi:superfamily I DNA/RNA helicase